ncbi:MAG: monovalent cation/H+ antiporter subunit D family protein [Oleiphilaceae bacterium]|nr:monovalent cation/H+ antiporter subunit D family protein [Oleiphilaceae bacterium]
MNLWASISQDQLINLAIFIPFFGAFLVGLLGKYPNLREAASIATSIILFTVVLAITDNTFHGTLMNMHWFDLFPGLSVSFLVEPLGVLFALVASFLWIVTTIYAIGYMRGNNEKNQTRFFICFALAISSVMAICFSDNLLTLFIFYEVLTLSTYPLVTHAGTKEAKEGGRIYLGILLSTSVGFLLFAILGTYAITGTLDFKPGGVFDESSPDLMVGLLLVLFCFGIGKAALMPFHRWLPSAMVAPTPVSALLHAVAVVKAGVFSILKVAVYIFGLDTLSDLATTDLILYAASGTMVIASIIAMTKDNLKARLAYSTIAQLSYIVLGAMLATAMGVIGSAMHIAAHAFGKITLFFVAGAIYTTAHKKLVSELDGIGKHMPLTMTAFTIGAISMIGLPPAAGFISKWYLLLGSLETSQWVAVIALILSTLLNAAYFIPIVYAAYFKSEPNDQKHQSHGEAPLMILIPLLITAGMTLFMFFNPELPLALAKQMLELSL